MIRDVPRSLPGGTENVAKTEIKKSFSLEGGEDEGGEKPESEGTRKTLDGVFEAMMPLSGKNKKRGSDSDSEDAPKRRKGRGAQSTTTTTTKKDDPDAEIKKEVSKVIKGSGPVFGTLHDHTMYMFYHVESIQPKKTVSLPRLKALATRARDVGNTLHGLAGNKAGEQPIPQIASGFESI